MSEAYRRLQEARAEKLAETFSGRSARARLQITRVVRDSLGNARQAFGTEDGAGEFPIMSMGFALEEGETIVAEREDANVANPLYRYLAHLESDVPAAGLLRIEPGPPPDYATTWHTERIETINGASFARITIYFKIDPSYSPSKVYISHKPSSAADWTDQAVPFVMTTADQAAELAVPYASGVSVDIQISAEYQYAYSPSVPSATRVVTTPTDGVTPGAVTAMLVDVTIPGIMKLKATGTFDRSRYIGIRYEIATVPGGPAIATPVVDGEYEYYAATGGAFYVAAAPISRSNVLGTRFPGVSTFAGPYTVAVAAATPDNTAPAAWAAPTVTNFVRQRADGSQAAFIRIAFPVRGVYEPDYAATGIRLWNGTTFDERTIPYRGTAPDTQEYQVDFGSWTVWIYAIDASQNKSALSTSASTTITPLGIPPAAGNPVIRQIGLANEVTFTAPTGAETVQVERSDDASGTVNVVTVYEGKGTSYLDLHTELTTFPKAYYYRVRGRNFAGDGVWSSRIIGTITALSGIVVAANTLQGDAVIANTLDAQAIKTNTILSALIKTANAGTRWEIEGDTGGANEMQIRMYELIAGLDKKRIQLDGTGFFVYNDAAQQEGKFYRDASTHARFSLGIDPGTSRPTIDVLWDTVLGLYVSDMDVYAARQRWRANTGSLMVRDNAPLSGGAANMPQFYADTGAGEPITQFVHATDGGPLSIYGSGIGSGSVAGLTFKDGGNATYPYWMSSGGLRGQRIHAGNAEALYCISWPSSTRVTTALGNTGGNTASIEGWEFPNGDSNTTTLRLVGYRGQTIGTNDWRDSRFMLGVDLSGFAANLGSLQLGARGYSSFWALGTQATAHLFLDEANNRITTTRNLHVGGALSKTSGSFVIPDPTPGHERDELRHCFAESPSAGENLYTYVVKFGPRGGSLEVRDTEGAIVPDATIAPVEDGPARWEVAIPLPDYWPHLNRNPRAMAHTTGDGWGRCKARVSADKTALTLLAEEGGEYTIDLRGTRQDAAARSWWDRRGVRKTAAQQWTNDHTADRRAATVAARKMKAGTQTEGTTGSE